jgi:hypothetical protein
MGALRQTATSNDADTELQKQAVSAIARRPTGDAVPLLAIRDLKTYFHTRGGTARSVDGVSAATPR